jgi:ferredoxin
MIVAKRKPFNEIVQSLEGINRVLLVGCGTCVAVCMAGGEKEVGLLSSQLAIFSELAGKPLEIGEVTVERQCDREFLDELRHQVGHYDALLSLACGVGIQFLADQYPDKIVLPGVDTIFIGANEEAGYWTERCRMCGQCYLARTAAVCPVTICPKRLLNGPCSGTRDGKCEVDAEKPCAWTLIYERLERKNRLDEIKEIIPPRDHGRNTRPLSLIHKAYKRRYTVHG